MGLIRIVKFLTRRVFELLLIVLVILYLPRIPPEAKFERSYKVAPTRPLEGSLKLNEKLNDVEIWHKGDMHGPEAFADFNGELYTTLHGGDVVKLVGNHITPVVKFGKPCRGYHEEKICGRPLGMAFDKTGTLYVADAYYGIHKVDVKTGKKERLVAYGEVIGERNVTLPNSVTVASNGDLFWTDSSTEFSLQDGVFDMLADGSGRLIHYEVKTKKNTVLISDLHFANGIVLSEDETFVLVAETARNRIHRYYLKGPKKGTHDTFIEGLPGFVDNLKSDGKSGFIVPLVIAVDADHPAFTQILGPFPLIRKFIARLFGLLEFGFKLVNEVYQNEYAERGIHFVGHFTTVSFLNPKRITIVHLSKNGEILDSVHCLNKKLTGISEAHVFKDNLYLGSPFNDYIGRISLDKIGWGHLKHAPTTTTPKSTTTTPKPTTTTPKPTTTTPKPTTTTPRPTTTTTPKPTTTTPKSTTTQAPTTTPKPAQSQPVKDQPKDIPVKGSQKNNKKN